MSNSFVSTQVSGVVYLASLIRPAGRTRGNDNGPYHLAHCPHNKVDNERVSPASV